jgi:hypothetical protein
MTTRHFTREQLEQIGVPFELDGNDSCANELSNTLVGSQRWTDVRRLIFRAPDDGQAYSVTYEVGSTEHQDGIDPFHRYGKTVPTEAVVQRPVLVQQWRSVGELADAHRAGGLEHLGRSEWVLLCRPVAPAPRQDWTVVESWPEAERPHAAAALEHRQASFPAIEYRLAKATTVYTADGEQL